MTLRIRSWNEKYEDSRTRQYKHLRWVPIPNDMTNVGYVRLVTHANGAAHLGVWLALAEIASTCAERGTLVRSGKPLTVSDIALISRLPEQTIREAIDRLMSPEIGWIEDADAAAVDQPKGTDSGPDATPPQDVSGQSPTVPVQAPTVPVQAPTESVVELNRTELNSTDTHTARARVINYTTGVFLKHTPGAYELEEDFCRWKSSSEVYGMRCSDEEWQQAYREWLKLPIEEQLAALKGVDDRIVADDRSLVNVIPRNYLATKMWHRRIREPAAERKPMKSGGGIEDTVAKARELAERRKNGTGRSA